MAKKETRAAAVLAAPPAPSVAGWAGVAGAGAPIPYSGAGMARPGRADLAPPRPIRDWQRKVSMFPTVRIDNGSSVQFGGPEHLACIAAYEERERSAREVAPQVAQDELRVIEAELKRHEDETAAARKAAVEVDDADPFAFQLRTTWAARAQSLANMRRETATAKQRLKDAREFANSPLPVTVDAVRRRRGELLDELGLEEIDLQLPPAWRPKTTTN